jgi:hypothetical protein
MEEQKLLEEEILRIAMQNSKILHEQMSRKRRRLMEEQNKAYEESLEADLKKNKEENEKKTEKVLPTTRAGKAALFAEAAERRRNQNK